MRPNERGVSLGMQNNITPENVPMLSELECDLINLFRALPEGTRKQVVGSMLNFCIAYHEED